MQTIDPSKAYLDSDGNIRGMHAVFEPRSVAVVGATDRQDAVGKTVVENLKSSREAKRGNYKIFPINPTRSVCCGLPCYPDIASCPGKVDLVVIVTPAKTVKQVVEDCGKAGVAAIVVISAGFKEVGHEGEQLEREMVAIAHSYGIRLIGPNCLGIMAPHKGVNATFAATDALSGNIAFVSQSGAMCTAVLDWSLKEQVGFSAFVSIGSMADVDWGDLIDYFGNDSKTDSILIYMESIGNASHFLSAAKVVSMTKPIIVIKAGQTEAAAQAAASHTGSLAGSHDAFLAAMKRAGVMVVDTIGELFDCALALGKQPRPRGENLLIITNAGGPGVLATDATTLSGATVCQLEKQTIEALNSFLPSAWSHANPVDILGDAGAELYAKTMEVALADKNADGVLIILSPQAVTDATGTARKVIEAYQKVRSAGNLMKPILCSWMGGNEVVEGFNLLNVNGIPTFQYPDSAARTFGKIWKHTKDLQMTFETAGIVGDAESNEKNKEQAVAIMKAAQGQGRFLLTEAESKRVLKAYGVPVAETIHCSTIEKAVSCADQMGYPCVVKLHSETITHKSDVGGVKLNLNSAQQIKDAWMEIEANVNKIDPKHFQGVTVQPMLKLEGGVELILGSFVDSQFGPLVLFGAGGCMVEVFKDKSLGIPPLTPTLAKLQIESTNIYKALKGGQGQRFQGTNLTSLNSALCKFSLMISDLSEYIAECDINPLLALKDRLIALDARIVLHKPGQTVPKLAIRPFPQQYVFREGGRGFVIRPCHVYDINRLFQFQRQFTREMLNECSKEGLDESDIQKRLIALAASDYARTIALAAVDERSSEICGILKLSRSTITPSLAELKVVVREDMQRKGMGEMLMGRALEVAKSEKLRVLEIFVRQDNISLLHLASKNGFKQSKMPTNVVKCSLDLS